MTVGSALCPFASIASTVSTLAFFSSIAGSRMAPAGQPPPANGKLTPVPPTLFDMRSPEAAVIAAALPGPDSSSPVVLAAWLDRAASGLAQLRKRGGIRSGNRLAPRCAAFYTVLASETCEGARLGRPSVVASLRTLPRAALILLADNLAHEYFVIPHDEPVSSWQDRVVDALAGIQQVAPLVSSAGVVPALLSVACAA